jgi:hypothetical protein
MLQRFKTEIGKQITHRSERVIQFNIPPHAFEFKLNTRQEPVKQSRREPSQHLPAYTAQLPISMPNTLQPRTAFHARVPRELQLQYEGLRLM